MSIIANGNSVFQGSKTNVTIQMKDTNSIFKWECIRFANLIFLSTNIVL
jgi:hypothetical protein